MSLNYLVELEERITNGRAYFACQGIMSGEWHIADSLDTILKAAERTSASRMAPVEVFRLVSRMEVVAGDSYLVATKILESEPGAAPAFRWAVVDTPEAAEMVRDVSEGPTPYFGVVVHTTVSTR
jgi:hypothetical protein